MRSFIFVMMVISSFAQASNANSGASAKQQTVICGGPPQTLWASVQKIDKLAEGSEQRECLTRAFVHTTFMMADGSFADYASVIRSLRDRPELSYETSLFMLNRLQQDWVERYFSQIGNQSVILDTINRTDQTMAWSGVASISGALAYLAKRYKQELGFVKLAARGVARKSARPLLTLAMIPFGNTEGLTQLVLSESETKVDVVDFVSQDPMRIPPSPAFVFLANDDEEFDLSYDEFAILKDFSAISGAATAASLYAFTRAGHRSDAMIRLFLMRKGKQYLAAPTITLKAWDWIRRSRKLTHFTPAALVSLLGEKAVAYSWDAWKDYSESKNLENARHDFLTAMAASKSAEILRMEETFSAEVYLNAATQFMRFQLETYLRQLVQSLTRYHEQRFCSSYRFLERSQDDENSMPVSSVVNRTLHNGYKVWRSAEDEFNGVTVLNRDRMISETAAIHQSSGEALEVARKAANLLVQDLALLPEKTFAQKNFKKSLQARMLRLKKMTLMDSIEEVQRMSLEKSEELIAFQFNLKAQTPRLCSVIGKEIYFRSPQDILTCYKDVADSIDCSSYFGWQ